MNGPGSDAARGLGLTQAGLEPAEIASRRQQEIGTGGAGLRRATRQPVAAPVRARQSVGCHAGLRGMDWT
jgi:hypothetical protein